MANRRNVDFLDWIEEHQPELAERVREQLVGMKSSFALLGGDKQMIVAVRDAVTGGADERLVGDDDDNTLWGGEGVDRLIGGDGDDKLYGGAGNDVLEGGAGKDVLGGGSGRDGASYASSTAAIKIDLTTNEHTGDAEGDRFRSIDWFLLTEKDDTFIGSARDDEARGGGGKDSLSGKAGVDWLRGGAGDDTLDGGEGDDVLEGGAGADVLRGGAGEDAVSYSSAVSINLSTNSHAGDAQGDTFSAIEHFRLSGEADTFVGASAADWVAGYGGNDALSGGIGADTLNGGAGDDILSGGDSADKLIGEAGNDQLTGGAGSDEFKVTAKGFGTDLITDFEKGVDLIKVTGYAGVDGIEDLSIANNSSGWAVITFPDGSSITLNAIDAAAVTADFFDWGG